MENVTGADLETWTKDARKRGKTEMSAKIETGISEIVAETNTAMGEIVETETEIEAVTAAARAIDPAREIGILATSHVIGGTARMTGTGQRTGEMRIETRGVRGRTRRP